MTQDDLEPEDDVKSKSQVKREMHSLQSLGKELAGMSAEQLSSLPLGARLHDALLEYRRLKHNEARRRQLQFIGRLMREVDQEALEGALEHFNKNSRHHIQAQQRAERWRERLLQEPEALQAFIDEHPATDIQHLRQLVRQALKEQKNDKPPASARKLFRYLLDLIANTE